MMERSVRAFFDANAPIREQTFADSPILSYEQECRQRAILTLANATRGQMILDVGCGTGTDVRALAVNGASVVGIDASPAMIREAPASCEVGDVRQLRWPDETFDTIICSEVIEHIPDATGALLEMRRVLKPNGALVLSTPNRQSWYGLDRRLHERVRAWSHPYDHWRTSDELAALLEVSGFRIGHLSSVCRLPGYLLTYWLPRRLQRSVVAMTRGLEACRWWPGYLWMVRATKGSIR